MERAPGANAGQPGFTPQPGAQETHSQVCGLSGDPKSCAVRTAPPGEWGLGTRL